MSLFILGLYAICGMDQETLIYLTREDGYVESMGAAFFGISGFLLSGLAIKYKNIFLGGLGALFLFGAGEEISWGQRILGIETPSYFLEENRQQEMNIHNLSWFHRRDVNDQKKSGFALWLNMSRLFSLFWITYSILLPMAAGKYQALRTWLLRIRFPLSPPLIGVLFLLNYGVGKILELTLPSNLVFTAFEIKETNFAFLFACTAIYFYFFRERLFVRKKE